MISSPIFAGLTPHHYAAIVADPPWNFRTWSAKGNARSADSHYDTMTVRQLIIAPRREHSRKPEETRERIEQLVTGPYLELFARETRSTTARAVALKGGR